MSSLKSTIFSGIHRLSVSITLLERFKRLQLNLLENRLDFDCQVFVAFWLRLDAQAWKNLPAFFSFRLNRAFQTRKTDL